MNGRRREPKPNRMRRPELSARPRRPKRTYVVVPAPGTDPCAADDIIVKWLLSLKAGSP